MKKSSIAFVAGVAVAALMVISMVIFAAAQTPNSSGSSPAQGATTGAAAAQGTPGATDQGKQAPADVSAYYNLYLQKLAANLGVSQDKLTSSMSQALQATLAQAVSDGKLTQAQATERASQWTNMQIKLFASLFMGDSGSASKDPQMGGIMPQIIEQMYQAAAAKLGMTTDQLKQAMGSGQTIAQIAASKGVSEQDLKDAVINAIKPTLDQAVKDGKITQADEDNFIQNIRNTDLSKLDVGGNPGGDAMKQISSRAVDSALQATAGKLGITVDQLWSDVDSSIGRTLGDVAAEKNVSVAAIKTAVVNAVKPGLDRAVQGGQLTQADENSIIQGIQNDDFSKPFDQFGFDDSNAGLARQVLAQVFKATEAKLGITEAQLNDQLTQGKSLADMAQSKNVSVADLKTAIVNGVKAALDQAVQAGKVTQDFANAALAGIQNADLSQSPKMMLVSITSPGGTAHQAVKP